MAELSVTDLRYPGDGSVVLVASLSVASGERLVVFGPNGAGKTSLLRLLAGTLPGGPDLEAAYLPQRPHLFRGPARRTLHLGLDDDDGARAEQLADELGVAGLLDADARSLSGGERQRVCIARVLASPEGIVLLDEPLAPLDVRDRRAATRTIARALEGRTAVIVTHDLESVATLAGNVAVMIGGAIRQTGSLAQLLSEPLDDEVAEVVGIGNAIGGVVREAAGSLITIGAEGLDISGIGDHEVGDVVKALFGAEAVSVFPGEAPPGSPRNAWAGTVTTVREVGKLVEVVVDCGSPIVALITPGARDALGIDPGVAVGVEVKATAVRVVSASS